MISIAIHQLKGRPLNFAIANTIWKASPEKNFDDYWWKDDVFVKHNIQKYPETVDYEFDPQGKWMYGGYYFENYVQNYTQNHPLFSTKDQPHYVQNDKNWAIGETPLIATCRLVLKIYHENKTEINIPNEFFIPTHKHNIIPNQFDKKIITHPKNS